MRTIAITTLQQQNEFDKKPNGTQMIRKKGELVDRIEHHVDSAGGYIFTAHEELTKAQEYQSKARKVPHTKWFISIRGGRHARPLRPPRYLWIFNTSRTSTRHMGAEKARRVKTALFRHANEKQTPNHNLDHPL